MVTKLYKPFTEWPVELHRKIIQYLPYLDLMMLMSTNRHFRALPDREHLKAALLELEMDEDSGDGFDPDGLETRPCCTCLRVLDEDKFYMLPSHFESPLFD
jgi:F-box domain